MLESWLVDKSEEGTNDKLSVAFVIHASLKESLCPLLVTRFTTRTKKAPTSLAFTGLGGLCPHDHSSGHSGENWFLLTYSYFYTLLKRFVRIGEVYFEWQVNIMPLSIGLHAKVWFWAYIFRQKVLALYFMQPISSNWENSE